MEDKLQNYRTKKRREALINNLKDKFYNMVSFNQIRSDSKSDHVSVEKVKVKVDFFFNFIHTSTIISINQFFRLIIKRQFTQTNQVMKIQNHLLVSLLLKMRLTKKNLRKTPKTP